jgi:hypothetical protein
MGINLDNKGYDNPLYIEMDTMFFMSHVKDWWKYAEEHDGKDVKEVKMIEFDIESEEYDADIDLPYEYDLEINWNLCNGLKVRMHHIEKSELFDERYVSLWVPELPIKIIHYYNKNLWEAYIEYPQKLFDICPKALHLHFDAHGRGQTAQEAVDVVYEEVNKTFNYFNNMLYSVTNILYARCNEDK